MLTDADREAVLAAAQQTPERLAALQAQRLAELLQSVARKSPFYARVLRGRDPARVRLHDLPVVSLRGRVYNDNEYCPTLHTSNGRVYGLVGDVSRLRDDSRVRVTGWMDRRSTECGNMPTIEVRSISRY